MVNRLKMKMSNFSHIFHVAESTVFFNSLKMIPVFLSHEEEKAINNFLNNQEPLNHEVMQELLDSFVLVDSKEQDELLLDDIRNKNLTNIPYPVVAYFILSEDCNLACKYCFLGNSCKKSKISNKNMMSKNTARRALLYFSQQIKHFPQFFNDYKEIIFYGGEPLLNFEVLKYVISEVKKMQEIDMLPKQLGFSLVTNGLLLDQQKIDFFKSENINVSISIDGIDERSNSNRVDKTGRPIFRQLIKILDLVKASGLKVGLSITLTENTIKNQNSVLDLLEKYEIIDICFNILIPSKEFLIKESYYNDATDFIIEFFKRTRGTHIYEDRIMRKVKAFVGHQNYLSDCAATSGNQIVIVPDGKVGICHGCLENKDFFFTTINDIKPVSEYEIVKDWSGISPVNNFDCLKCEALGLCGGGCPVNARNLHAGNTIHSIDKPFCIHSKKILRFLIEDLYAVIHNKN